MLFYEIYRQVDCRRVWPALIALAGLAACDVTSSSTQARVRLQFGQSIEAAAPNGLGEPVSLAQFSGEYVWVDYAAEWCAACRPQSATIRSLARKALPSVEFVTVMTSENGGYGHPANEKTAARWANRLSLDAKRVVAADLTFMTLPQHALFGPDGREIFRHVGAMSAGEIEAVIAAETGRY